MAFNATGFRVAPAHAAPRFQHSDVLRNVNLGGPKQASSLPTLPRPRPYAGQELDLCAHNTTICGLEAGCHNVNGTFICLCSDLEPKRPREPCRKTPGVEESNGFSQNSDPAPPGSFTHHQILDMNRNFTLTTKNPSTREELSRPAPVAAPLLGGLLALLGSLLVVGLLLVMALRRRRQWCGRGPGSAPGSLNKCMQQYVTNPTYYASAPETPLRRVLHDVEICADNICFVEEIGEGCFGKVHKAVYTLPNGEKENVAVKVLKESVASEAQADFEREVQIMSSFQHDNIIKLLGVVFQESGAIPWMVFEFMQHGDLAGHLRVKSHREPGTRKVTTELTLADLSWIATQIANGMCYLSSQHFVHRDLATRNCLVGHNLCVKISDFGMSRDIYTCDYYKIRGSRMLPVRWMAPESIMYGKFTLESDVWSYGVVLWEIFTYGKQPYYGHSNEEVVKLILQGILLSPPEECPPYVYNIMAGCWKTEPRDRLSFDEIYKRLLENFPTARRDSEGQREGLDSEDYLVPRTVTPTPQNEPL